MIHITILNRYGAMTVNYSRLKGATHQWTAANTFDIYTKGVKTALEHDQARNLALQVIIDAHLPAIALKRVTRAQRPNSFTTETKRMF